MSHQKIVQHRALWISDVHLGSQSCKAKQLASFLRYNHSERLYLVGDIFDGWKLNGRFHWTPDQSRVVDAVLAKARRGTEVYYITGNHDAFIRRFVRRPVQLGRIRLVNEAVHTTADGRRLLVLHGDAFDEVVAAFPRLSLAGDHAYEALMSINQRWNRAATRFGLRHWSLSASAKTLVKGAVQYLSGFDEKVVFRCRQEKLQGVICGHTHHAEVRQLRNGITSYNCGDWVESCTALAEDFNGHVSILETLVKRPARAVPERRPATYVPAPSGPIIIAPPAMRDAINGAFPVTQRLPVRGFAPRATVLSAARLASWEGGPGASENWPQLR